mmetsp:Transcript_7647/g.26147  ORF Transcript_7647/g.26147 Transcript_7647/m.26147 type:complete len:329 (+) Transcript_7647:196-1182(+)
MPGRAIASAGNLPSTSTSLLFSAPRASRTQSRKACLRPMAARARFGAGRSAASSTKAPSARKSDSSSRSRGGAPAAAAPVASTTSSAVFAQALVRSARSARSRATSPTSQRRDGSDARSARDDRGAPAACGSLRTRAASRAQASAASQARSRSPRNSRRTPPSSWQRSRRSARTANVGGRLCSSTPAASRSSACASSALATSLVTVPGSAKGTARPCSASPRSWDAPSCRAAGRSSPFKASLAFRAQAPAARVAAAKGTRLASSRTPCSRSCLTSASASSSGFRGARALDSSSSDSASPRVGDAEPPTAAAKTSSWDRLREPSAFVFA